MYVDAGSCTIGSSRLSLAPSSSPSAVVELSDQFTSASRPRGAPLLVIVVEARHNGDEQQDSNMVFCCVGFSG